MLIKELSYCYQGKIFIKYNDDIEIGDTITLLDETTTTFGIFEIDAFEHTFDERGLITVLFVKAKVNHVDPFLDLYNLKLGYNLINEFQEKVILENNSEVTLNFKLKNIFGFYLKTLLQSPKYLVPKYMESSGSAYELFNSDGKIYQFEYSSIQTPIRIFPVLKRGKMVYPSTLEFAFFNDDNSEIDSFITMFLNKIAISMTEAKMQKAILTKVGELTGELMESLASSFNIDTDKFANAFKFEMNEEEVRRLMESMSAASAVENAETNLLELAELFRRAALVISLDSGSTHLARATNIPRIVSIFCWFKLIL